MSPAGRPYSAVRRPWHTDPGPSCYDGDWHYFGRPGFCGGRYNGGSFGFAGRGRRSVDLESRLIKLLLEERARVSVCLATAAHGAKRTSAKTLRAAKRQQ